MSEAILSKPTRATVCDLCGKEIEKHEHSTEVGSLTHGYIAHSVTSKTKYAWLRWPSPEWFRKADWKDKQKPENRERQYDFHGQCIVDLVEANLFTPKTESETA